MKKNLLCAVLLTVSSAAQATPARMAALAGNGGFAADTDLFIYPSALGGLDPRTMMTDNGGFEGGVIVDDGQALWFERDTVANDIAAAGPLGCYRALGRYRALYAKGNGASGYLLRTSQTVGNPDAGRATVCSPSAAPGAAARASPTPATWPSAATSPATAGSTTSPRSASATESPAATSPRTA